MIFVFYLKFLLENSRRLQEACSLQEARPLQEGHQEEGRSHRPRAREARRGRPGACPRPQNRRARRRG